MSDAAFEIGEKLRAEWEAARKIHDDAERVASRLFEDRVRTERAYRQWFAQQVNP
jgi:hypothetical protein